MGLCLQLTIRKVKGGDVGGSGGGSVEVNVSDADSGRVPRNSKVIVV